MNPVADLPLSCLVTVRQDNTWLRTLGKRPLWPGDRREIVRAYLAD
jgi:hypothetical protein